MSTASDLPGGIILGSEESIIRSEQYSFVLPWLFLKTKVILTDRRIAGESPNLLLGLIPIGSNKANYPLRNVAATSAHTSISVFKLIIGLVLALLGLVLIGQSPFFVVAMLLGILLVVLSFKAAITFTNNAGQTEVMPILMWEKGNAQAFINQVNTTLADRD